MQKVWRRIFLLCMACMICLQGLCLADDEKENWVEYYRETEQPWNIYYVDTNSIKALDYNGRKYLEANVRRKEETYEYIWVVVRQIEVTNAKWHKVFDIENQKVLNLEFDNKYANPKKGKYDISELGEKGWDLHKYLFEERLEKWIEQNYPAVINKIRTHNQSLPGAKPAKPVNTGATGAPNVPSGSLDAIVGDIDYEVLDSGAVKFNVRCPNPDPWTWGFNNTFYICAKPEKFKAYPGKYVVGVMSEDDGVIVIFMAGGGAFDYDPKTQAFTFYVWDTNNSPETSEYEFRMRVIDKNTVHLERFYPVSYIKDGPPEVDYSDWTGTFKYIPCDAIPYKIIAVDGPWVTVDTVKYQLQNFRINPDRCLWFGGPTPWGASNNDSWFGAEVDMARAFFAVNGNIGEAPCDVEYFPRN